MNVLFCVRHSFHEVKGGMYIQIIKTIKYLELCGVNCDITDSPYGVDYNKYDILHLTDLTWIYDNLLYLKEIEKSSFNGPKVLSTIYWPFDDYAENGVSLFQAVLFKFFGINGFEFFKSLFKFMLRREFIYLQGCFNSYISSQRKIVQFCDLLLPNSNLEMLALKNRLNLKESDYKIIYNAIDIDVLENIKNTANITRDKNLILFVARIDSRKNQLGFLKAVFDLPYKIRFIGSPGPNSKKYYAKLLDLGKKRGNVEFISHVSQEEVFKHMLEAQAHVLTSWIETPGLVSLEAAFAGCNIIVSDKGSVRDYFGDYAYYCDPSESVSIHSATIQAMNSTPDTRLIDIIKKEYNWKKTAIDTLTAYNYILNKKVLDDKL